MKLQNSISIAINKEKEKQQLKVIIDRIEPDFIIGRTEYDSPEIDQEVLITKKEGVNILPGDFANVVITQACDYDLYAEIV